jgi:hypothetical protein
VYEWMREYPGVSEKITAVRTYGTVRAEPYAPSGEAAEGLARWLIGRIK